MSNEAIRILDLDFEEDAVAGGVVEGQPTLRRSFEIGRKMKFRARLALDRTEAHFTLSILLNSHNCYT